MKKFIKNIIFCLSIFFVVIGIVKAETFYEGSYISGEYINKVINGKTYYMTMQFIKDSNGNIVYCLEPFVTFEEGKSYSKYDGDLGGYKNLSDDQNRRISLIIYYGYGYGDRISSKWYVITQYLLWNVVDSNADIYFTDSLNGKKITKYVSEQKELLRDVDEHDEIPSFVKDYTIGYKQDFLINGLTKNYEIVSSDFAYGYNSSGNLIVSNVLSSGNITLKKISNYYDNKVTIYDSKNSQDLIKPGNIDNSLLNVGINVNKGNITLDIRDDDSVYTIESDFSDTCYEIIHNNNVIDTVCTGDEELIYRTNDLGYGDYQVKQISVGKGYLFDTNIYDIRIDDENSSPSVILYNKLLKNHIQIIKKACFKDICEYEGDAIFEIYDRNHNLIKELITDNNGYSSITLGYGNYMVKQINGLDGYTLSDSFNMMIVDETTEHVKELYNYYIEKEDEEVKGENLEIPDTKVDFNVEYLLKMFFEFLGGIFAFFR